MRGRIGSRLTVISVASFLVVTGVPRMSAAIGIDNDVVIDWGNCSFQGQKCGTAMITGSPRTVGDGTPLKIMVQIDKGASVSGLLEVAVYDDQLTELCFDFPTSCRALLHVASTDFDENGRLHLAVAIDHLSATAILVVKGRLFGTAGNPHVSIVVRGAGDVVLADRVGDVNLEPSDAADIPPRSIELLRALDRLEKDLFSSDTVELDAVFSGRHIAVGWTHTLLAKDAGLRRSEVKKATLRLTLSSGDPCASDDVILLDRAVTRLATGRSSLPVVRLRDLQECPTDIFVSGRYSFTIDLMQAPVRTLSLDDMSLSDPVVTDLTGNLANATLNVIVARHSTAHDSALDITLKEPRDR